MPSSDTDTRSSLGDRVRDRFNGARRDSGRRIKAYWPLIALVLVSAAMSLIKFGQFGQAVNAYIWRFATWALIITLIVTARILLARKPVEYRTKSWIWSVLAALLGLACFLASIQFWGWLWTAFSNSASGPQGAINSWSHFWGGLVFFTAIACRRKLTKLRNDATAPADPDEDESTS
jgi:hypothetical protein